MEWRDDLALNEHGGDDGRRCPYSRHDRDLVVPLLEHVEFRHVDGGEWTVEGGLAVGRKKDRRKEAIAIIYHDVLTGIRSSWGGGVRAPATERRGKNDNSIVGEGLLSLIAIVARRSWGWRRVLWRLWGIRR